MICDAEGPCSAHASGDVLGIDKCPGFCDDPYCRKRGVWDIGEAPVAISLADADWPIRLCTEHLALLVELARQLGR